MISLSQSAEVIRKKLKYIADRDNLLPAQRYTFEKILENTKSITVDEILELENSPWNYFNIRGILKENENISDEVKLWIKLN